MDLGCKYLWLKYLIIQTLFFIFFIVIRHIFIHIEVLILINSKYLFSLTTKIMEKDGGNKRT